jgi:hypothetical protein
MYLTYLVQTLPAEHVMLIGCVYAVSGVHVPFISVQ